jgi:hypothetical protein
VARLLDTIDGSTDDLKNGEEIEAAASKGNKLIMILIRAWRWSLGK